MSKLDAKQRGAALIVGMVFLVALSLTALIAMNRTILQERMTGAYRSEQIAYAAAESALRAAEWTIWEYPAVRNLSAPPVPLPSSPLNCLFVCAPESAYPENTQTGLREFTIRAASSVNAAAANPFIGMVRNDLFLTSGIGSQSAFAPVAYREALGVNSPPESFGQGRSGLKGDLRYFRLTSRGYGPTADIERTLQSTFSLVE